MYIRMDIISLNAIHRYKQYRKLLFVHSVPTVPFAISCFSPDFWNYLPKVLKFYLSMIDHNNS